MKRDIPSREIVGHMQSGPIYFSRAPTAPVNPNRSSNIAAAMREPWTYNVLRIRNNSNRDNFYMIAGTSIRPFIENREVND